MYFLMKSSIYPIIFIVKIDIFGALYGRGPSRTCPGVKSAFDYHTNQISMNHQVASSI